MSSAHELFITRLPPTTATEFSCSERFSDDSTGWKKILLHCSCNIMQQVISEKGWIFMQSASCDNVIAGNEVSNKGNRVNDIQWQFDGMENYLGLNKSLPLALITCKLPIGTCWLENIKLFEWFLETFC